MPSSEFSKLEYDIKMTLNGNSAPDHLDLEHDTAKNIVKLAKNIALHTLDMTNHKPREPKDTTDFSIRMSELGEPCHRKLLYKWYKPEKGVPPYAEPPAPYLPVKFTYGDYIEELALFLCAEAGHTVTNRQEELKIEGRGRWYAIGHIDAQIDNVVVDVKSAADGSFQKYKREGLTEENDTFGYSWQIDAYATAKDTNERAFVFVNKHDGEFLIIDRSHTELLPVRAMINKIGDEADDYLAHHVLPPRIPTDTSKYGEKLGVVCSYCNFKYACYDGNITGVISSGKPTYLVTDTMTAEGRKFAKEKTTIATPEAFDPPF